VEPWLNSKLKAAPRRHWKLPARYTNIYRLPSQ